MIAQIKLVSTLSNNYQKLIKRRFLIWDISLGQVLSNENVLIINLNQACLSHKTQPTSCTIDNGKPQMRNQLKDNNILNSKGRLKHREGKKGFLYTKECF